MYKKYCLQNVHSRSIVDRSCRIRNIGYKTYRMRNIGYKMLEWREFPSAPCLAGKKNTLMTARLSLLLKSRASLICFRDCFLPGRAKDLSAPRYNEASKSSDCVGHFSNKIYRTQCSTYSQSYANFRHYFSQQVVAFSNASAGIWFNPNWEYEILTNFSVISLISIGKS